MKQDDENMLENRSSILLAFMASSRTLRSRGASFALVSGVDMTRQRSGKQQNMLENGVENRVKSLKFRAPGVVWGSWVTLLAPRWPKMRFGTRLGLYLEVCWGASWRQDGPSCGQDGAKLPNLAPRWAQDGHLRLQNGQLETILGGILPTFKDIGCEKPDSRKPTKN